ncbi:hypothetical protein LPC08_17995 [Roseomonas sp. OT10]|uniref:hypothetical protein n=1 Tax=Roseomonas cutis TaxID=2897332 RepID=UPI001E4C6E21|nr:hypothetical protein [Roseomonas sp. OT10]UFN47891.1 hypothetical protein LPC08_17995 [Roseomonas sp. OT10]
MTEAATENDVMLRGGPSTIVAAMDKAVNLLHQAKDRKFAERHDFSTTMLNESQSNPALRDLSLK